MNAMETRTDRNAAQSPSETGERAGEIEMTCIVCPMGCRLRVSKDGDRAIVRGNTCRRGEAYGAQELLRPMRVVTSSVRKADGSRKPCPVKTKEAIPKDKIPQALRAIKAVRAPSNVRIGDVLLGDVAGTGVPLVATANR